jgi:hypothetical protein
MEELSGASYAAGAKVLTGLVSVPSSAMAGVACVESHAIASDASFPRVSEDAPVSHGSTVCSFWALASPPAVGSQVMPSSAAVEGTSVGWEAATSVAVEVA